MIEYLLATCNGVSVQCCGQESKWQLIQVDGLSPMPITINYETGFEFIGSRFNSKSVGNRNIVIYLKLNGDAHANRWELYPVFATGNNVDLRIKADGRDVKISGLVETNEVNIWSDSVIMQISIVCEKPALKSYTAKTITNPTSSTLIKNDGDIVAGFSAVISMTSSFYGVKLTNVSTNKSFSITTTSTMSSTTLDYSSVDGERKLISRSSTPYVQYMDSNTEFIKLQRGNNYIAYYGKTSSTGGWTTSPTGMSVTLTFNDEYIGV